MICWLFLSHEYLCFINLQQPTSKAWYVSDNTLCRRGFVHMTLSKLSDSKTMKRLAWFILVALGITSLVSLTICDCLNENQPCLHQN